MTNDAKERKALPLASGCLDYFPDALLAVAEVSRIGNEQHNPGQPLHWAKEKSLDEADALSRHLLQRGTLDTDGVRHSAKVAWRALALLQREIEVEQGYGFVDGPDGGAWCKLRGSLSPGPWQFDDPDSVYRNPALQRAARDARAKQVVRPVFIPEYLPPKTGYWLKQSAGCIVCGKTLCWDVKHSRERSFGRDAYRDRG